MRNLGNISDLYEQVKLNESKIKERKLTDAEKDKLKKLEKEVPMKDFKDRYGKEGEAVYYATLTKMAKKEGFASDAQRRAAFAQGYKAKGKKGKKEETELDEKFVDKDPQGKKFGWVIFNTKTKELIAKHDDKKTIEKMKKNFEKMGEPVTMMTFSKAFQYNEEVDIQEDGHVDVASAVRQCKTITEDAMQMLQKLQTMSPEDALPTWWTNKLAVAASSLNKLRDYIKNPIEEGRRSKFAQDDEDEEGANKHIVMQLRKTVDLKGNFKTEFEDGKKQKVPLEIARKLSTKYNMLKKPIEKEIFQKRIAKSYRDLLKVAKEK